MIKFILISKIKVARSVSFFGGKLLVKLHFKRIKLIYFAISINMVVLIDNFSFSLNTACSVNTTRKIGSLSKTEKKHKLQ